MAADKTSGSAASFADLQTAIENFLTTDCGWSAAAGPAAGGALAAQRLWTKGDLVVRVAVEGSTAMYFIGATGTGGGTSTGDAPLPVKLGSPAGALISFPFDYEIVWNDTPEEVYITIAYSGNKFQHINFGQSDIPDIGGTGMWITGSYKGDQDLTNATYAGRMFMGPYKDGAGGASAPAITAYGGVSGGFFMHSNSPAYGSSYIHCGLEGVGWKQNNNSTVGELTANMNSGDLLMALPSLFNESEVLLPIYAIIRRSDNVWTIAAVMRHARVMRIDNVDPEEVVPYGSDQWKCYPLYAKNASERNGVPWATGALHSGTFGVAIRYLT